MESRFLWLGWLAVACLALIAAHIVLEPLPPLPNLAADRAAILATAPYATNFDFPVGWPNGHGYYDARSFGTKGHMGSDLNGVGGENTDLGDSVYAIGDGVVIFSDDAGPGWGNCIIIGHRIHGRVHDNQIDSFYGHLQYRYVRSGDVVARGQKIGTIGTANGRYFAHLHFEIRRKPWLGIRRGYHEDPRLWSNPIEFLSKNHRNELANSSTNVQTAR